MHAAVEVNNLTKVYDVYRRHGFKRSRRQVTSVDGISFSVPYGQAVAFIGPNGAGKSTTIRMLTGILRPTAGDARVLDLVPWRKRCQLAFQIGAVFGQRSQLWYHLPAGDTFDLLSRIYNLDRRSYRERRDMLVECFELNKFLHTPVRKLSLGQRMRAEVAAALLHRPRLLLLDEPTIGLDIHARQQLRALIKQWNREEGLTVFLTSHDTGDIESVAQRVIIINHGQIMLDQTVEALASRFAGHSLEDTIARLYKLDARAEDGVEPDREASLI